MNYKFTVTKKPKQLINEFCLMLKYIDDKNLGDIIKLKIYIFAQYKLCTDNKILFLQTLEVFLNINTNLSGLQNFFFQQTKFLYNLQPKENVPTTWDVFIYSNSFKEQNNLVTYTLQPAFYIPIQDIWFCFFLVLSARS